MWCLSVCNSWYRWYWDQLIHISFFRIWENTRIERIRVYFQSKQSDFHPYWSWIGWSTNSKDQGSNLHPSEQTAVLLLTSRSYKTLQLSSNHRGPQVLVEQISPHKQIVLNSLKRTLGHTNHQRIHSKSL